MLKLFFQNSDMPLDTCLFFLILGVSLIENQKFRGLARKLILTGIILMVFLTNGIIPSLLLLQLENKFPSLLSVRNLGPSASEIQYIVVLGGLAQLEKGWPLTSQLGGTMLIRLAEGMRLSRELPQARLILSGGSRGAVTDAEMMKRVAVALGVSPDRLVLETKSANTAEEAFFLKKRLGEKKFILVTSARHMPRAMALFRHIGLNPIPAPTNHLAVPLNSSGWNSLIPRSSNMNLFVHVIYEYLGFIKAKLTRTI